MSDAIIDSNPLVRDRIPVRLPRLHAPVVGQHFHVRREELGDASLGSIYRGDFTYVKNPSIELDFRLLADDGSENGVRDMMHQLGTQGFEIAQFKDFRLSERIKLAWKKDPAGRITLLGSGGGKNNPTLVLAFRVGSVHDEMKKRESRMSDDIQKSFEEKVAEGVASSSASFDGDFVAKGEIVDGGDVARPLGEQA